MCDASVYPQATAAVDVKETHMSWLFLTDYYVYKFKKPVRLDLVDFSSLSRRLHNCREELRLNRRLAPEVYLGLAALVADNDGCLRLEDRDGALDMRQSGVVEWLVKMRRLPSDSMLDHLIATRRIKRSEVDGFVGVLSDFYQQQKPITLAPTEYIQGFHREIDSTLGALRSAAAELPAYRIGTLETRIALALDSVRAQLKARARENRLIEAHGDLRPEHVYIADAPVFIDCLEFDRRLRTLDPVDELSFLAMECELAGAGYLNELIFDCYYRNTQDAAAESLKYFYKICRALVRARLSIWHLKDTRTDQHDKWITRTGAYLSLVNKYLGLLDL